jgi:hypothetical protein
MWWVVKMSVPDVRARHDSFKSRWRLRWKHKSQLSYFISVSFDVSMTVTADCFLCLSFYVNTEGRETNREVVKNPCTL